MEFTDLKDLRSRIDEADRQLLEAFEARMRVSEEIAVYKKEQGLPVSDPVREGRKLETVAAALPEDLQDYGRRLYQLLFQLSKEHQAETAGADDSAISESAMDKASFRKAGSPAGNAVNKFGQLHCGLLGQTLQHSYSPMVHRLLTINEAEGGKSAGRKADAEDACGKIIAEDACGKTNSGSPELTTSADYDYRLFEIVPEHLDEFLKDGPFQGINVTIPYKKEVAKRCAVLSETAKKLGSVNTVVRRADGALCGDNTDYFGFAYLLKKNGIDPRGRRAVVLGSGGASVTVCAVLEDQGALVKTVSRMGRYHYGAPEAYADAQILVNTTPVGMYPENGRSPIDLKLFPRLEAVLDIVYNPARTALLLQAEELGIPCAGGLSMLAAQAWKSRQIFLEGFSSARTDAATPFFYENCSREIDRVAERISADLQNIILIGMAGCGKTTLGRLAAGKLGRPFSDSDEEFEKETGMKPGDYILSHSEDAFRAIETEVLARLGKKSGAVIATGGGAVTRPENYPLLHQNGRILWVRRSMDRVTDDGRPLSQREGAARLYEKRKPLYERFADGVIDNDSRPEAAVSMIVTEAATFLPHSGK